MKREGLQALPYSPKLTAMTIYVYTEAYTYCDGIVEAHDAQLFLDEQEAEEYLEKQKEHCLYDEEWKVRMHGRGCCSLVCDDGRSAQLSIFKREL